MTEEDQSQNILPFNLEELLRHHLLLEDAERSGAHPRKEGVYWPSEIWDCARKVYFERVVMDPATEETLKFGALGNILHEYLASVLKKMSDKYGGYRVSAEVQVKVAHPELEGVYLSGRVDDLIELTWPAFNGESSTRSVLIELKTVSRLSKSDERLLPKKEHVAQINLYLSNYKDAAGVLIYVSRANLDMMSFTLTFDRSLFQETMERVKTIHGFLSSKIVPPAEAKESPKTRWMCSHCQYAEICAVYG